MIIRLVAFELLNSDRTGQVERMEEKILVGKPEGNRPVRRPRRRWEDNIKMDLREIAWGGMDWIDLG
jgi:hypothetical protein